MSPVTPSYPLCRCLQGQHDVFRQLFAVDLDAEGPAATRDDHKQAPVPQGPEQHSSTDMRPAHWQQAVAAQLLVMEAQAAAAQQQWDRAEERLAKVCQAVDGSYADMLLLLLTGLMLDGSSIASGSRICIRASPEQPLSMQ